MPTPHALPLQLTDRQRSVLEPITRQRTSPYQLVQRAQVVLLAAEGHNNTTISEQVHLHRHQVRCWRQRWQASFEQLKHLESEEVSDSVLTQQITTVLSDQARPGGPAKFTVEQIVQIVAVACEPPASCGRPISHWTPRELADEVVQRGIVASISPRSVGRFLKEATLQPHRNRYWLNAQPEDPGQFQQQVHQICDLYLQAPTLEAEGIHVISCDEMTGIQALERAYPTQAMTLGQVERQEFEYIRHGTLSLIASWQVAQGQVCLPSLAPTRNETDFALHIDDVMAQDPHAGWVFVVDQLNTHQSESLVRLVAAHCQITQDLGIKGKSGILQSMPSRAAFLSDPHHRIRFVYVPKHTSWLNQIECWFSILARRLLKRGQFTSTAHLKEQILKFVDYFNRTLAKPFLWKFKGFDVALQAG